MKKLIIIIALLSVIILLSPKLIGGIVETEYQSAFDKLNNNPAITIKTTTFSRHWFSGKVVTEMSVQLQHEEVDELDIIIEDDIVFGPLVFTNEGIKFALSYSQSSIQFNNLFIEEEVEDFIKNKIHLFTLFTFSKDIITHTVIDEVSKEVDGNKIVSSKAVGEFVLENDNRIYGSFNWAGLSVITADKSLIIEESQFSLDQTLISGSYYQGNALSTGSFDFAISGIEAKDASGHSTFSLSNLLVDTVSSVNDELMQIRMSYSADKLVSSGLPLDHVNLTVVLNSLDISVMKEINGLLTELSGNGDEVFSSENMNKLSALTAKLLAKKPVVEIEDFSVVTPEGKIESVMRISADEKQFKPTNFMSILSAINATAHAKAPKEFFAKLGLAPMVDHYINQGFITEKEEQVSVDVNYTQGQLAINGNVMPL
jgi:uncharacterized protein YdgA (DUF945 family)